MAMSSNVAFPGCDRALAHAVVGDENVHETVVIKITERNTSALPLALQSRPWVTSSKCRRGCVKGYSSRLKISGWHRHIAGESRRNRPSRVEVIQHIGTKISAGHRERSRASHAG